MSTASEAKFDIREDEEQYEKLQDCVDLLVASGYFRARIKGLSAFDKIVGGMAWCISICNFIVDVDLLYSENSTIGQKIALTERIVEVLPILKCPHSIEPHQIQGLDFIHIFPVIQWLVKKTIEVKKEHGDQLEKHAQYLYEKANVKQEENSLVDRFSKLSSSVAPRRVFKRGPTTTPDTVREDALCTLAEYSDATTNSSASTDVSSKIGSEGLEETSQRDRISTKALRKIVESVQSTTQNEIASTTPLTPEEEIDLLEKQISEATAESARLDAELEKERSERDATEGKLLAEKQRREEIMSKFSPSEIEEFRTLLSDYDQMVKREKDFKSACRTELESIETQIESLQNMENTPDAESALEGKLEEEVKQLENELASERLLAAEAARALATSQRQLDSFPSKIEMAQYQQRFIELYNQMASKHRETKQYFTLHNTLVDVRDYMKKEIQLLAKIEEVLPMATKDAYRDSFIQNLQEILRTVEGSHDKLARKSNELEQRKTDLTVEYAQLKENERAFHRATERFEKLCAENEELREQAKAKGIDIDLDA